MSRLRAAKGCFSTVVLTTASVALIFSAGTLRSFAQSSGATVVQLQNAGVASIPPSQVGIPNGIQGAEFDDAMQDSSDADGSIREFTNRSVATTPGIGQPTTTKNKAKSNPQLNLTFDGLNLFQQRFANGGNQFTVEPPDQALCAGAGFVLESVNDVLRVFDASSGNALMGVVDLNTFYGYPSAIDRATASPFKRGPSLTDPVCYFDSATQRWFHVVLTLDHVGTSPSLNGKNHLDIAVSQSPNPLGAWSLYKLPVQNDGTDGTPNHSCSGGPCLGDYPHIGADAGGIYLTTNEFSLFGSGFYGSQIYTISKQALVNGAAGIPVFLFNTADSANLLDGAPGFTVWPAQSPGVDSFATVNNGTEYLMSSVAVFSASGVDNRIRVWSIGNTSSLNTSSPTPTLTSSVVNTIPYAVPSNSVQKPGDYPQGQLLGKPEGKIGRNDSRMQQTAFANGKLWGALDCGLLVNGAPHAGLAYFVINPQSSTTGKIVNQGYVALANNDLTRPAVGVTPSGRGVIGFTVVGNDYYPSAGYVSLDALVGVGDVHVAAIGLGPQDGFTEYRGRARWGDYGAAAVDGNSIWIGNEYINQTCTVAQYLADNTCSGTRAPLGNWGTRITKLTP